MDTTFRLFVVCAALALLTIGTALATPTVVINEFMARNSGAFRDEDSDASDWIELRNTSTDSIHLVGWSLTDDVNKPNKWMLPATNMRAGAHLLIWASGKDRTNAGSQLHTNFKLSGDGEYLGLYEPGNPVAVHDYSPAFPPQVENVSYGLPALQIVHTNLLLGDTAACRALVPSNGSLGMLWTAPDFDDSAWLQGYGGVGFDNKTNLLPFIGIDVRTQMYNRRVSCYARYPFVLGDDPGIVGMIMEVFYDDGFAAFLNGSLLARAYSPDIPVWDSLATGFHNAIPPEFFRSSVNPGMFVAGTNVLAVQILNQRTNSSDALYFGRVSVIAVTAVSTGAPDFLADATPGTPNADVRVWTASPVEFDVIHGVRTMPFDLHLSCATTGANIRYTTDFSVPSISNGLTYTTALTITNSTIVRAIALVSNMLAAPVETRTYLSLDDVLAQNANQSALGFPDPWIDVNGAARSADYAMDQRVVGNNRFRDMLIETISNYPTLSLVTDMSSLFSSNSGIYANPRLRGDDWEPLISAEYCEGSSDPTGFAVNCGLSIQGEINRIPTKTKKHSLQLLFKARYGPGKLRYPLFKSAGIDKHDTVILRGMFGDGWINLDSPNASAQYLRDQFAHDCQRDMGWLCSDGEFMYVYLNGLFWGLYNANERPDAAFMEAHIGGPREDWDVLKGNIGLHDGQLKEGSRASYEAVMALVPVASNNITDADYQTLKQYVDMEQYIDYMLLEIFLGNDDWPQKNWYCVAKRNLTDPAGPPAVKFRFFTWDSEATLRLNADRSKVGDTSAWDDIGPGRIYRRVRRHPEFQRQFADRVQKHLFNNGALTPATNAARYARRGGQITQAICGESARWGDAALGGSLPYNRDTWLSTFNYYTNVYFKERNAIVISQLRAIGLYPSIATPSFSQHGGAITSGFALVITAPQGTIYYTLDGTDPWVWNGDVATNAFEYSGAISLYDTTVVRARAKSGGSWSALNEAVFRAGTPPIRVTELMYHPAAGPGFDAEEFEFIELYNISNVPTTLARLNFSAGIDFSFSNQPIVCLPESCVVVVKNPTAFATRYNTNGMLVVGPYAGSLANSGERITLADTLSGPILSFTYADTWYPLTDGGGPSLEIIDPYAPVSEWDNSNAWRIGDIPFGSPGTHIVPEPVFPVLMPVLYGMLCRKRFRLHNM